MAEFSERYEKHLFLNDAQFLELHSLVARQGTADKHGRTTIEDIIYCQPMRAHRRGIVPLGQVKLRSYGVRTDKDAVFFELKTPIDNIIFKRRIPIAYKLAKMYLKGYRLDEIRQDQAFRELDYVVKRGRLQPTRYVARDRVSYNGSNWRISFDVNIRYRDFNIDFEHGNTGVNLFPAKCYLMTVRTSGGLPKWLEQALSTHSVDSRNTEFKQKYERVYFGLPI